MIMPQEFGHLVVGSHELLPNVPFVRNITNKSLKDILMPASQVRKQRREMTRLVRQVGAPLGSEFTHPLDVTSSWPANPGEYKIGHALDTLAKRRWREGTLNLSAPFNRSLRWYWVRRECGCGVVFTLRVNACLCASNSSTVPNSCLHRGQITLGIIPPSYVK